LATDLRDITGLEAVGVTFLLIRPDYGESREPLSAFT